MPDQLGLRLNALDRGDDDHGEIHRADGALHLGGKVAVPRGVDDIYLSFPPLKQSGGGADRDAAPAFKIHKIGMGAAVIHTPQRTDGAGPEEHLLRQRRLSAVDMGQDADRQRACFAYSQCIFASRRGGYWRRGRIWGQPIIWAPHICSSSPIPRYSRSGAKFLIAVVR